MFFFRTVAFLARKKRRRQGPPAEHVCFVLFGGPSWGCLNLSSLVNIITNIEQHIQNSSLKLFQNDISNFRNQFEKLIKDNHLIVEAANKFLVDHGNAIEASKVIEYIINSKSLEELHFNIYNNHILVDFRIKLKKFNNFIDEIASKQDKVVYLEISGDEVLIEYNKYSGLIASLTHIFRNMIYHGIESKEERKEKKKPENGLIKAQFENYSNHFLIILEDDGKGIDPIKVKSAAIEKDLKSQEEIDKLNIGEVFNLVFLQGLSTKENVTNLSGRGVGMEAVQTEINLLSGTISAWSEIDKGSKFIIKLPY